jgi:hypothetical protein
MSEFSGNKGIIMGPGSSMKNDVLAVGDRATATQWQSPPSPALQALRDQLAKLSELVERNGELVDTSQKEAVELAVSEAAKEKPNKLILSSILEGTATALKSIASVGSAALAVKALVASL